MKPIKRLIVCDGKGHFILKNSLKEPVTEQEVIDAFKKRKMRVSSIDIDMVGTAVLSVIDEKRR